MTTKIVYFDRKSASKEMLNIAQTAYGYNGQHFKVVAQKSYALKNYWAEGSRATPYLVTREGLNLLPPSQKTTDPFSPSAHGRFEIPPGHFIVEHNLSRGKDMGVTFFVRPDEMDTGMLPSSNSSLTSHEQTVLKFTAMLKSSYAGIKDYRFSEASKKTNISREEWDEAIASLIEKNLLRRNKSITPEGRNAISK